VYSNENFDQMGSDEHGVAQEQQYEQGGPMQSTQSLLDSMMAAAMGDYIEEEVTEDQSQD